LALLITRDHRAWMAGSLAAAAALTVGYLGYASDRPAGPSGGSWAGLFFGVAGTACMVAAGLLSARKRVRTWRLGGAQTWMRAHLWLGLLAVPCIWFHSGFALGGALTTVIMVLFYVVITSGLIGTILQQIVPGLMTRRVPLETVHGQIAHVVEGLATDAYELVASMAGPIAEAAEEQSRLASEEGIIWRQVARLRPADAPAAGAADVRAFYLTAIRPYLRGRRSGATPDVRALTLRAPEEWRPRLDRLQAICEEARQLAIQERLHRLLHGWLFVHAPLSLGLFVLVAVHIVFALRY
jgi:hypothetical protein